MLLISFNENGKETVGVVNKTRTKVATVRDLLGGDFYDDMNCLIENISAIHYEILGEYYTNSADKGIPIETVELLAPIHRPKHDIICVGLNYKAHVEEFDGRDIPQYPVLFSKRGAVTTGHNGEVVGHLEVDDTLDYEVELAVIIGKTAYKISEKQAEDHIFGYTILNDFSARDTQLNHNQWFLGKSGDGFSAFGPWIMTKDELPIEQGLSLSSRVNGELRQNSNTDKFIFSIPQLISTISQTITLMPGDIIGTGTPSGVGKGYKPPRYLKSGDVVECEIQEIGILRNIII